MQRTTIVETIHHIGEEVLLKGWVHVRRNMGKLIFIDLRDRSGIVQVVCLPNHKEALAEADKIRPEYVVAIRGKVNARPEKQVNKDLATGTVEIEALEVTILNTADTTPFEVSGDSATVNEELRMEYRYVDLRTERMQRNMQLRHNVNHEIRDFFTNNGFWEIETPVISKSTPEGARDYLVPSRNFKGQFYALPQSPQQYKQLLMVGGIERYFQIAKCFRDEETRKDRQPEFTQLDMEMSFVEREDVMQLIEGMLIAMVTKLCPNAKIQQQPFPRMTYADAMKNYGSDRPDLRKDKNDPNEFAFCWVIDFPFFEKTEDGGWTFTHNPFSAAQPEHREWLMNKENVGEIITSQYDIVLNGYELGGGSIRNHRPEALKKVFEIMGYPEDKIEEQFGHMLKAFSFGAPPHGGIALGIDRVVSLFAGEYESIREVIAFPKTAEGRDLLMHGPSQVEQQQLDDLGIAIKPVAKKD
jgi:aspartyl-tRNA synthetase